jgi:hypothetical protein
VVTFQGRLIIDKFIDKILLLIDLECAFDLNAASLRDEAEIKPTALGKIWVLAIKNDCGLDVSSSSNKKEPPEDADEAIKMYFNSHPHSEEYSLKEFNL